MVHPKRRAFMFSRHHFHLAILVLLVATLACNIALQDSPQPTASATAMPAVDATKITLEIQGTAMAGVLTQQAAEAAQKPTEGPAPAVATNTEEPVPATAEPT